VDRETREICERAARRFEELGCVVEEFDPHRRDPGGIHGVALAAFVVDRNCSLRPPRSTQPISSGTPRRAGADAVSNRLAERERARFTGVWRRCSKPTICSSPQRRHARLRREPTPSGNDRRPEADQLHGCIHVECGHDHGRLRGGRGAGGLRPVRPPVGLQFAAPSRGEATVLGRRGCSKNSPGWTSFCDRPEAGTVPPGQKP